MLNFATGFKTGKPIITGLADFQFFILHNIFCWVVVEDNSNLIREVYLEIARKNGKTFLVALIIIVSLIVCDNFSQLFSGGKTREIASLTFDAITEILMVSPKVDKYFKRTNKYIRCLKTNSKFATVSSEANNANGKRPQLFVLDEVATLTDFSLSQAMKYGQMSVNNPLAIYISTAYTIEGNIFKQQCELLKNILDGIVEGEHIFGMLFELDEKDLGNWNNFDLWHKASPIQMSFSEGRKILMEEYEQAMIFGGSSVSEFQSKMLNMWVSDAGESSFINYDDLKKCRVDEFNWNNREVYCGLDMSISTDNTAMVFVTESNGRYYTMSMTFIPEDKRLEKENLEKVPYGKFEKQGFCISCKDRKTNGTIDYNLVEQYFYHTVKKYNFKVKAICTDNYHIQEMKQHFEDKGYNVIEIKQRATDLGSGTELLQNSIIERKFAYVFNPLLEINFKNAKANRDFANNLYIDKKKSNGRIDIVDSIINCFCMIANDKITKQNIYETSERSSGFLIF